LLVVDALASLTAITLDRCVSFQKESEIEAANSGRTAASRSAGFTGPRGEDAAHRNPGGDREGLNEVGNLNAPQQELVLSSMTNQAN
jgi:hypothetical protein